MNLFIVLYCRVYNTEDSRYLTKKWKNNTSFVTLGKIASSGLSPLIFSFCYHLFSLADFLYSVIALYGSLDIGLAKIGLYSKRKKWQRELCLKMSLNMLLS